MPNRPLDSLQASFPEPTTSNEPTPSPIPSLTPSQLPIQQETEQSKPPSVQQAFPTTLAATALGISVFVTSVGITLYLRKTKH